MINTNRPSPLLAFLLLLGLALSLFGAGTTASKEKAFLWKLQHGDTRLYLLGSIHVAKQELFPLKADIEAAYTAAEGIVVEVDLHKASRIIPVLLQQHAFLAPEKRIADVISPESNRLLQDHLKQVGIEYRRISQMKPWYLSLIISNISLERIGAKSYLGIDQYFTTRAYRDGKEVIELEGAAMQLEVMDSLPFSEQEFLMRSAILDDSRMETVFDEMVNLWLKGDLTGLEGFFKNELTEYPELKAFNRRLIVERNRTLTEKILDLLGSRKTLLVIIGAAHFTGEDGILRRLEEKGYRLVQE